MSINKLATWIHNNALEVWFAVGLLCLFAAIITLAVASYEGLIDPGTGKAPVVLVHATPGLGR